jgi:mono/diheme cytochrome c family protein
MGLGTGCLRGLVGGLMRLRGVERGVAGCGGLIVRRFAPFWRVSVLAAAAVAMVPALVVGQTKPDPTAEDLAERARKAHAVTHTFQERYKADLTNALKDGPVAAVGAYAEFATGIASTLSEESPFEITRTALRVRNGDNVPDAWELANLEKFAKEIKAGADPKKLEVYNVTTTKEGQKLFRYMRPIMMGEQCLVCHGADVKGDVKSEIAKSYPDDKALGYILSDMRGAFTLIQQLD